MATAGGRPRRRPSWPRALLLSLAVVVAGVALGAAGYQVERSHRIQTPQVATTNDGLLITAFPSVTSSAAWG